MVNDALFSSKSVEWGTPQTLFDYLNQRFQFTLDVCATPENAKCERYFTRFDNGLSKSWKGERCWMNPPYGRAIGDWAQKAMCEADNGALVVGLLPARVDTQWWHFCVKRYADVHFIQGRLRFEGADNSAPFPSVIAVWWGQSALNNYLRGVGV